LLNNKVDYPYEDMVLRAIFKHGNPVRLTDLKNTFYSDLPPIFGEMYNAVVRVGLFPESPQAVRARNVAGGVMIIVLAGIAALAALVLSPTMSAMMWLLPFAIAPTGII